MNKYLAILYSVMVRSRREEAVKGSQRVASAGGRRWAPAGGAGSHNQQPRHLRPAKKRRWCQNSNTKVSSLRVE